MIVHVELRRETFLKVLCINDDGFVPKKLFLSGIEEFRKVPQIILQPNVALNGSVQVPRCSAESWWCGREQGSCQWAEKIFDWPKISLILRISLHPETHLIPCADCNILLWFEFSMLFFWWIGNKKFISQFVLPKLY